MKLLYCYYYLIIMITGFLIGILAYKLYQGHPNPGILLGILSYLILVIVFIIRLFQDKSIR